MTSRASLKKRFIGTNIRLIQDIIEYAQNRKEKGLLLFLDFEKAFDSVEWNTMFKILRKFNFGESFINWVETLYKNPTLKIKNNGHLSNAFEIERGVKQGCPLSSLLFVIVVEILSLCIRQNTQIRGFKVKHGERDQKIKLSQYADDGTLLLRDKTQITEALREINNFSKIAGPKLNINKTIGLIIGEQQPACGHIEGINITTEPIKCLGVFIGPDIEKCEYSNWNSKLEHIKLILSRWEKRDLTIFGKITLIKTMILPKLTFLATNTTIPQTTIKDINKVFFNYIWGKRDRIKQNVLIQEIEHGGVGMIDIEAHFQAVKASWLGRIFNSHGNWNILAQKHLNSFGKNNLCLTFNCVTTKNMPCLNSVPKFYQEIIIAHSAANNAKIPTTTGDIIDQYLWGNKYLTYTNGGKTQCMFSSAFIKSNILKVCDLKFIHGKLDQKYIHNVVSDKRNIFKDISLLNKALKPYNLIMDDHTPLHNVDEEQQCFLKKCKDYYKVLIELKKETPRSEYQLLSQIPKNINFKLTYIHKIKNIKNPKLAQFNYKLLHMILPCNENLRKWGKRECGLCEICGTPETIFHLVHDCTHAQIIWNHVARSINTHLSKFAIFIGTTDNVTNYMTSLISFLIYKEWLIANQEHRQRSWLTTRFFLRKELIFRMQVQNLLGNIEIEAILRKLLP